MPIPPLAHRLSSPCPSIRNSIIVMLLSVTVLAAAPAHARSYDEVIRGKTLVEGLGFEGVLTVYDETTRMFKTLGQPREDPKYPEWYFYDFGTAKLTVRAKYTDGKFLITFIRYARDENASVATNSGIRLGESAARIMARLGEPEKRGARSLEYPGRGVTYHIGKRSEVIGVTVYRPSKQVTSPDGAPPIPAAKPVKTERAPLGELGLEVALGPRWSKPVLNGTSGASVALGGVAKLTVITTCDGDECRDIIQQGVQDIESDLGANRLEEKHRLLEGDGAAARGADKVYVGRYSKFVGGRSTWLFALTRGTRYVVATLAVTSDDLSQPEIAHVAEALSSLGLVGGEE
ncbi:MAG: hypothetical protein ACI9OJ_001154 [Myxococcota bacterium]|jgi:hypothetical protein